mmetsp:Transcript_24243/g.55377  ORF Transcript_24243/g.55377 Transcript_24243/m.55377 type:complete len:599 (-) Transcript_24243:4-1800(-)
MWVLNELFCKFDGLRSEHVDLLGVGMMKSRTGKIYGSDGHTYASLRDSTEAALHTVHKVQQDPTPRKLVTCEKHVLLVPAAVEVIPAGGGLLGPASSVAEAVATNFSQAAQDQAISDLWEEMTRPWTYKEQLEGQREINIYFVVPACSLSVSGPLCRHDINDKVLKKAPWVVGDVLLGGAVHLRCASLWDGRRCVPCSEKPETGGISFVLEEVGWMCYSMVTVGPFVQESFSSVEALVAHLRTKWASKILKHPKYWDVVQVTPVFADALRQTLRTTEAGETALLQPVAPLFCRVCEEAMKPIRITKAGGTVVPFCLEKAFATQCAMCSTTFAPETDVVLACGNLCSFYPLCASHSEDPRPDVMRCPHVNPPAVPPSRVVALTTTISGPGLAVVLATGKVQQALEELLAPYLDPPMCRLVFAPQAHGDEINVAVLSPAAAICIFGKGVAMPAPKEEPTPRMHFRDPDVPRVSEKKPSKQPPQMIVIQEAADGVRDLIAAFEGFKDNPDIDPDVQTLEVSSSVSTLMFDAAEVDVVLRATEPCHRKCGAQLPVHQQHVCDEHHMRLCPLRKLPCDVEGCGDRVKAAEWWDHRREVHGMEV